MHKLTKILIISLAIAYSAASYGTNEEREIKINGERLDEQQISILDLALEDHVPNGKYWLDEASGAWGLEGSTEMRGVIPEIDNYYPLLVEQTANPEISEEIDINISQHQRAVIEKTDGQHCTYYSLQGVTTRNCK